MFAPAAQPPAKLGAVDLAPLATLLARIGERWQPQEVWRFGSRARGTANVDSDWDLLVVAPDSADEHDVDDPLVGWRLQKDSGVHADVVACRAADFSEARDVANTLAYEATRFGVRVL